MAQTLSKNDSPTKVTRAVRRHLRLSRRSADESARTLAQRITGLAAQLDERMGAARGARQEVDDAFDDWWQDDQRLDRAVCRAHRKCLDWDADHAGSKTAALVFGGCAPSEITSAPREGEPDLVVKLVARGKELPEGHPASAVLVTLGELATASRASHRRWIDAEQRAAAAEAAVETARQVVVRAYRDNHIDIERACGADVANDCFPPLRHYVRGASDEDAAAAGVSDDAK